MKYLEVFSGIGGFREAANLLAKDLNVELECVGHIENDDDANALYDAHFKPSKKEFFMKDLHDYRKRVESGRTKYDLTIGDIDMILAKIPKERYEGCRNTTIDDKVFTDLLFVIGKCLPEFVLIETSSTLYRYNKGQSLQYIFQKLGELGYFSNLATVNASEFGTPQERYKLYILATIRKEPDNFIYNLHEIKRSFYCNPYPNSTRQFDYVNDLLEMDVKDLSLWLSESAKKYVFAEEYNGRKLFHYPNASRTMSLKPNMCKTQRANADNYYSYDFIQSKGKVNDMAGLTPAQMQKVKKIRKLTHLECIRLQGFQDSLFEEAMWAYIGNTALYRIIADAVNVNTGYAVLKHILLWFGFVKR